MPALPHFSPSSEAITAHLDGEAVLLHMSSRRYFRLNETAAELWGALESGVGTMPALTARLCEQFAVDPEEAEREIVRLLGELESRGLVHRTAQ